MKEIGGCNHMFEKLSLQSKSESFNFQTIKAESKMFNSLIKEYN